MALKILISMFFLIPFAAMPVSKAQDYDEEKPAAPPPAQDHCNGIFLSYVFVSREREYPFLKNVSAQAWAFRSLATVLNAGTTELKAWKIFIGFQHREILVSASGAVLVDHGDLPAHVGRGAYLAGSPKTDLKTSIDTAGDFAQIQVKIDLTGTLFGVKPPRIPMPKTIRLVNDGYRCPAPHIPRHSSTMYTCCVMDPKFKLKVLKTKYYPRQSGDLTISYDIMQAYDSNYLAQVTMENNNPLGRLDHWNLTWEWMRGEFIYTMRGAYTYLKDGSGCIYGDAGEYYKDLDFSQVMNCQKNPVIVDLPPDRAKDDKVGDIPYCCRNGSLLPTIMNVTKAKAIFQVQVYKLPPDLNKTALYPPEKWKIVGILNPNYKCGTPLRVDSTEFPDPSGLQAISIAVASWQVVCNITRPKNRETRCCVSFSAYYNDSVIPCNTCACGCGDFKKCNRFAPPLLLPPESLLVPFENRTLKAINWAKIKHFHVPNPLPCGDNCGVSINWHVNSNYGNGWTARITIFNWEEINFEDWFLAIQLKKKLSRGYEKVYSFNGTLLQNLNYTIFFQGLPGMTFLTAEENGTNPSDPKVPGKQQSIISFTKKYNPGITITKGDGFPSRVYFNGEECVLPTRFPTRNGGNQCNVNQVVVVFSTLVTIFLMTNHLH
ncbi:COBRA-like protein 10 [Cornus florida]|uniref:COBRA-like protein 10 n=1 Tax=Cornus florida TaxID=4283 RepID=UPI0028985AAD|nr:COBRA-like protein 10 [Cornus florida]